jgi:hypothetical protein
MGSPPKIKKAPDQIRVSAGGFTFTNFRKLSHDSPEAGRAYAAELTRIN